MFAARFVTALFVISYALPALAAYEIAPVAQSGTLNGAVRFTGTVPPVERIVKNKDYEVCGKGHIERSPVQISSEKGLRGAVIALLNIPKGKPWKPEAIKPKLRQKGCAYIPHLQVAQRNARLEVLNEDSVLHNIHAYEPVGSALRTMFNLAQPNAAKVRRRLKTRRGEAVRIECDAHKWMLSWVYLVKNPYYAVTDSEGAFRIDGIPPGAYQLTVWHPTLGKQKHRATIRPNGAETIAFTYE